jgi:hypothetical protein
MSVGTNDGSPEPFVKSNAKVATKVRILLKNAMVIVKRSRC